MNLLMRFCFAVLILFVCLPVQAQTADADGCKDHPLFNRLPNHYISACENVEFDAQDFPVGALDEGGATKNRRVELVKK